MRISGEWPQKVTGCDGIADGVPDKMNIRIRCFVTIDEEADP